MRTDRRTGITKLIDAFRNFANAPKNFTFITHSTPKLNTETILLKQVVTAAVTPTVQNVISYIYLKYIKHRNSHETAWRELQLWHIMMMMMMMEQSPSWEASRSSANPEVPRVLWNPELHCRIRKRPPDFPIQSQISPVHAFPSHFLKNHFNIIFSSTLWSSKWSLAIIIISLYNRPCGLIRFHAVCS